MTLFRYALRDALRADTGVAAIAGQRVWLREEMGPAEINLSNVSDLDMNALEDGELRPIIFIHRSVGGPHPGNPIDGYKGRFQLYYYVGQFIAGGFGILERLREAVRQAIHYRAFTGVDLARGGVVFCTFESDSMDYEEPMLNHALSCFDRYRTFSLRNPIPVR